MGLVDYSESDDSEPEAPPKTATKLQLPAPKKSFQKVVDRSNPGKIRVNLAPAEATPSSASSDEPPAKRARTGGGGGAFSGLNSFLPPPKNANKTFDKPISNTSAPRPGFHLKTSAEPGFSRDFGDGDDSYSLSLESPSSKAPRAPEIPAEQKPAEEVKLVGKPLMFKPLSVARNSTKKKAVKVGVAKNTTSSAALQSVAPRGLAAGSSTTTTAPAKISLFGISTEQETEEPLPTTGTGTYEPLFAADDPASMPSYGTANAAPVPPPVAPADASSLSTIADDLNLSAAARRELFGRQRTAPTGGAASRVVNVNMDAEYAANEELRASGEQDALAHQPVRAIQPGKHSLRQLVNAVQNQRDALEDSFAKGKTNRREASGKYGWG